LTPNKGKIVAASAIDIVPVATKADREAFVDILYSLSADDPSFVPQLRSEEIERFTPGGNPYFEHARHQLFLARRDGRVVGRIAAHIDELALAQPADQGMGPGTGMWGALAAEDADVAAALIARAEKWLREQGMSKVLAPMTLSVWEEPGLLVRGHDHPPTVLMGHNPPEHQGWIEAQGYQGVKSLNTYALPILKEFPPLIQRIIASGEKNARIRVRKVDLKHFDREVAIICAILNDAWSDNWGFVPFTPSEIAYTAKKLKPLVKADLVMIAEYDGEPVAFMLTLPDLNEVQQKAIGPSGKPSLLGWLRLGLWLWRTRAATMRVPLMGVVKRLQSSRMASQLAFMMIEYIRRAALTRYGATRGEIGWILEDNQGMVAIAEAIDASVNKEYRVYTKPL
jgi:GNAT superfamily N-acetyltransferase